MYGKKTLLGKKGGRSIPGREVYHQERTLTKHSIRGSKDENRLPSLRGEMAKKKPDLLVGRKNRFNFST